MAEVFNPEPEAEAEADDSLAEPPEWLSTVEGPEALPEIRNAQASIWITAYTITIVLIGLGNILIIGAIVKNKVILKLSSNMCLLSLVVSRAAIAFFVVPARIVGVFSEEYLGSGLCKLCHYTGLTSIASSAFSTACVAFFKQKELCQEDPSNASPERTGRIAVLTLWIVSLIYAIRAFFLFDLNLVTISGKSEQIWLCIISSDYNKVDSVFMYVDFVVLFVIPLSVISISYWRVIKKLKEVRAHSTDGSLNFQTSKSHLRFPEKQADPINNENNLKKKESLRTMKMVVGVAVSFFLSAIGPYILRMYRYANGFFLYYDTVEQVIYIWSYANGWISVLLLLYYRKDLYDGVKGFLKRN